MSGLTCFIFHCQRSVNYSRGRVDAIVRAALPLCVEASVGGPLSALDCVEISVVGRRAMARIHREFFNTPGATDVITFPYGEIVVCAAVAGARAGEFGMTVSDELALYAIHGLLHLAGYDDTEPAGAAGMAREQRRILQAASAKVIARLKRVRK